MFSEFWKSGKNYTCNKIKGYDGSVFHPEININETLYLFNKDLCRSLPLEYQKNVVVNGKYSS